MKVIVTGATGFIGRALVEALLDRGDRVVALSRSSQQAREALGSPFEVREWHPPQPGPWMEAVNGADGVVNLAGEPLAATRPSQVLSKRWTGAQKARILASRVDATTAVVEAIRQANPRPRVLVNQSAIGYYGSRGSSTVTEASSPGKDFQAEVCKEWEAAARPVEELGVRLVLLRTGIVLGASGGVLPLMVKQFRLFLGGTMGDRNQWLSWIHLDDEVGLILYALDHDAARGPINATAPNPITMDLFSRQLGRTVRRPSWVPLIGQAMKLGLGEQSQAVLASIRAQPRAAQSMGYSFQHAGVAEALRSLLSPPGS